MVHSESSDIITAMSSDTQSLHASLEVRFKISRLRIARHRRDEIAGL